MFTPRIEKVCKAFSKALRWRYSRDDSSYYFKGYIYDSKGSLHRFTLTSPSYGWDRCCHKTLDIQVDINLWQERDYNNGWRDIHLDDMSDKQIRARTVVVTGGSRSADGHSECSLRVIPFDEFTEEKLAEALEHSYKRLIAYCIAY